MPFPGAGRPCPRWRDARRSADAGPGADGAGDLLSAGVGYGAEGDGERGTGERGTGIRGRASALSPRASLGSVAASRLFRRPVVPSFIGLCHPVPRSPFPVHRSPFTVPLARSMPFPDRSRHPRRRPARSPRTLEAPGHEAWCVGGAIRDTLLGEPNTDYDIATSATPGGGAEALPAHGAGGRALRHRGGARPAAGTTRSPPSGRTCRPTAATRWWSSAPRWTRTWPGATSPSTPSPTIRSGTSGAIRSTARATSTAGLVRAVGDPEQRFREDYLRILRAFRFAARFEFDIEPATWEASAPTVDGPGAALRGTGAGGVVQGSPHGALDLRRLMRSLADERRGAALAARTPAEGLTTPTPPSPDRLAAGPPASVGGPAAGAGRGAARPERSHGADVPRDPVLLTALLCLDPVAVLVRLKASNAEIARATGDGHRARRAGGHQPGGGAALDGRGGRCRGRPHRALAAAARGPRRRGSR